MRFNTSKRPNPKTETTNDRVTNYEGGTAYLPDDPKLALWTLVTANMVEPTYYRDDTEAVTGIQNAVNRVVTDDPDDGPEFVLQLAAYARDDLYQRSVSQLLLVIAANDERFHGRYDPGDAYGPSLIRAYAPAIIQRADEPATCVAMHDALYGGTVPKPLKKGISDALGQFTDYHLAKYRGASKDVSLHDVLNVVHADPAAAEWFGGTRDEQAERYDRVQQGYLSDAPGVEPLKVDADETWQDIVSNANPEWGDAKTWRAALPYMGLFATVKNLRNLREAGLSGDEIFDTPRRGHGDPEPLTVDAVRRSKVYPFRFYQAWLALAGSGAGVHGKMSRSRRLASRLPGQTRDLLDERTREWLAAAMAVAVENIPAAFHDSRTFVVVDQSGSMNHALTEGSSMTYMNLAAFLGAVMHAAGTTMPVGVFGEQFDTVATPEASALSIPEMTTRILETGATVGGSTNGWKALDWLTYGNPNAVANGGATNSEPVAVDRIVMVTDCEIWDSSTFGSNREVADAYHEYTETLRAAGGERPPLYMLDVASYPDFALPTDYPDVVNISGWSEQVLDFMAVRETADPLAAVREHGPPVIDAQRNPPAHERNRDADGHGEA